VTVDLNLRRTNFWIEFLNKLQSQLGFNTGEEDETTWALVKIEGISPIIIPTLRTETQPL